MTLDDHIKNMQSAFAFAITGIKPENAAEFAQHVAEDVICITLSLANEHPDWITQGHRRHLMNYKKMSWQGRGPAKKAVTHSPAPDQTTPPVKNAGKTTPLPVGDRGLPVKS